MEFPYVLDERSGLQLRKVIRNILKKVYRSIRLEWEIRVIETYFSFGIMNCNDLTQYSSGDKIEKNEMGGACSAYGGRGEVYTGFR